MIESKEWLLFLHHIKESHVHTNSPNQQQLSLLHYTRLQPNPVSNMSGSITEHLRGSTDPEGDYHDGNGGASDQEEDDVDNSNYIYVVNTILSGTARLNVLLPTATILAFSIFAPLLTNDGKCTTSDRWLMGCFLALSGTSCVFFSLTDSFRTSSGRLYYGVATLHSIRNFGGGRARPRLPPEYRLRWSDVYHASLSLVAFLTFALLHNDVLSCYQMVLARKFINTFPLVVGFVISLLFVLFPSKRRGIGYPFLLQIDAFHSRK
ncbi:protein DMP7-like [Salvia miltiorrhiza]|uniref:protein DMP7-like n=1 Tax=Salvia miltiorrhiza TaxID=226208 RepID=UPI0025AB655F|nr:protein DMP7-like [Salvia miltiorrhiza]